MGKSEFQTEMNLLKAWHKKYQPILFVPAGDENWAQVWALLERLAVPTEHVWVNYDDGDGACYLASFDDAPPPEKVSYIAVYVSKLKNDELSSLYLLTDQDIECETCSGGDDDCSVCGGTGVEWLELDDVSEISRDPNALVQHFSTN